MSQEGDTPRILDVEILGDRIGKDQETLERKEDLTELWRFRTVKIWEINAEFAKEIKRELVPSDFPRKLLRAPTSMEWPSEIVQKFSHSNSEIKFSLFLDILIN